MSTDSDSAASTGSSDGCQERESHYNKAIRALQEIRTTEPLAEIAREHNVNRKTLERRYDAFCCRDDSSPEYEIYAKLLDVPREYVILEWCVYKCSHANPMTRQPLSAFVQTLAGTPPSKRWTRSFLAKHRDKLSAKLRQSLDSSRAAAFKSTTVTRHFEELGRIIKKDRIPPENIYNSDEKGIRLWKNLARQYIFSKDDRDWFNSCMGSLTLVTVFEAVAADGHSVPPLFVLPDPNPVENSKWWETPGVGGIASSDKGWTDDVIFCQWLQTVFLPDAEKRNTSNKPIVLIIDYHTSHIALDIQDFAIRNNIIIHILPPKAAHKLQPLDVGIFGGLQNEWTKYIRERSVAKNEVELLNFIPAYMAVRALAMTPRKILAAFKRTGIYPLDQHVFKERDFEPSNAWAAYASKPSTYLDDLHTSFNSASGSPGLNTIDMTHEPTSGSSSHGALADEEAASSDKSIVENMEIDNIVDMPINGNHDDQIAGIEEGSPVNKKHSSPHLPATTTAESAVAAKPAKHITTSNSDIAAQRALSGGDQYSFEPRGQKHALEAEAAALDMCSEGSVSRRTSLLSQGDDIPTSGLKREYEMALLDMEVLAQKYEVLKSKLSLTEMRLRVAETEVKAAKAEMKATEADLSSAEVHCALHTWEFGEYRKSVDKKLREIYGKKGKRRRLNAKAIPPEAEAT